MNTQGYLKLIIGPMFAGKSTELMRTVATYKAIGKHVVAINHIMNCRYGTDQINTHDKRTMEQCLICTNLKEINTNMIKGADIIVIEELQFFPDAFEVISYWVDSLGKTVIAAGLDGDSERNPFGDVLKLIPRSDEVLKLSALCAHCKDGTPGIFSLCKTVSQAGSSGKVLVGGSGKYDAVCRRHYNQFHKTTTDHSASEDTLDFTRPMIPINQIGGW
jgi:thymidine kinase